MKANRQPRKKSPRKTVLIFVAVLLLCTLAGGVVGFGFAAFGLDSWMSARSGPSSPPLSPASCPYCS